MSQFDIFCAKTYESSNGLYESSNESSIRNIQFTYVFYIFIYILHLTLIRNVYRALQVVSPSTGYSITLLEFYQTSAEQNFF